MKQTVRPVRFTGDVKKIPEIRPPSALIAESTEKGAFLEWNPNLENDLRGYLVYSIEAIESAETNTAYRLITEDCIKNTHFTDVDAIPGNKYAYAVTAVNADGIESPYSNEARITHSIELAPVIENGETIIRTAPHELVLLPDADIIKFNSGQTLIFDRRNMRMRAWISKEGTHLLSPAIYGNALDITEMDNWGFPDSKPATGGYPATPDCYTLPVSDLFKPGMHDAGPPVLIDMKPAAGRVTVHYSLPLRKNTNRNFTRVKIWETWREVKKRIGTADYTGFDRKIEIQLPSEYKDGYSICLNDAFGVNGSCDGAVSYETNWRNPYLETIYWKRHESPRKSGGANERQTGRYHPDGETMQTNPFKILCYPNGTMILSALRCYHSVHSSLSNYANYLQDGIFPNFMVDCAESGVRFTAEIFEYLYAENTGLEPPQLYMDAAFHYRRRTARLYRLPEYVSGFAQGWDWQYTDYGPDDAARAGMDMIGHAHHFWFSAPYAVDPDILKDISHPVNQYIKEYVRSYNERGIAVSFWVRPEFVKTSPANAFSGGFTTLYYGYNSQTQPPLMEKLEKEGLPVIRNHPEWIRYGRDGKSAADVYNTPYSWIPVRLSSGWYEKIIIPTLERMAELGFAAVFQDGGAGGMAGVEYTPDGTRCTMPYYWRWFQDISSLGMEVNGELPLAWGSSTVPTPSEQDAADPWAVTHQIMRGNLEAKWFSPRYRHIIHSMYAGAYMHVESSQEHTETARFFQDFLSENGHPDRVKLEGLRWDFIDPTGGSALRGWVWDEVYWEYETGRRVKYPSYAEFLGGKTARKTEKLGDNAGLKSFGQPETLPSG